LRTILLVAALGFVCVLPVHLAVSQYGLRREAIETLVGDAQSRAALAAVFLNDRRNEVRDLVDSGELQRHIGRTGASASGMAGIGSVLREFGRERRFGTWPCFSTLVFVSRSGEVCSEPVPDAVPLSLTFGTLRSLVRDLYVRPTYQVRRLEADADVLVLSVAVVSSGTVHGQLLAMVNPAVLDERLQDAPAFARRSVYLASQLGGIYAPRTAPAEWRGSAATLQTAPADEVVAVVLAPVASQSRGRDRGLAVRTPLPASELSLTCVEPAAAIPTVPGILAQAAAYTVLGVGLFLTIFLTQRAGWWEDGAAARVAQRARCFEALFEHLSENVLVADCNGLVQYGNRALQVHAGLEPATLSGRPVRALLGEVLEEADRGVVSRALQGRQPWFGRMRQARADGSTLTTEVALLPVTGPDGTPEAVLALQRDVSAAVQVADRLRQAQKMEAVGVLTDGIAHDFNNLLTVIQGNCALLLGGQELLDTYARDSVEEILRACDRAAAMTRRLLSFSRHKGIQLEVVDLNEVVGSIEKMLARLIRENVDMTVILADGPVMIKADIVQLEQVIINLTVNARDAMPRGGRLTVRVARRAITTRAVGANLEEIT